MNLLKFLLFFSLLMVVISCGKDDPVDPDNLYIRFDLDGEKVEFTGTTNTINTGSGPDVGSSAGFFDFTNDIHIDLSMEQDSITEEDFRELIGQKIKITECIGFTCGTSMDLDWDLDGDHYQGFFDDNPLPEYYFKINQVDYLKTVDFFGEEYKQVIVEGEFNLRIRYSSTLRDVTDGEFRLIFQESWF